jgi:hypothetical protein
MKTARPSLLATTATVAEAPQTGIQAEYSPLDLLCAGGASAVAGRASAVIGATVLGHLSPAATILRHLAAAALSVLEEARERPHAVLVLLPWFVGGKRVLAVAVLSCHCHRRLCARMVLLLLAPPLPLPLPPSPPSPLPCCGGEPTGAQPSLA